MALVVHYNSYTVVIYTKATAAFAGQVDIYIETWHAYTWHRHDIGLHSNSQQPVNWSLPNCCRNWSALSIMANCNITD